MFTHQSRTDIMQYVYLMRFAFVAAETEASLFAPRRTSILFDTGFGSSNTYLSHGFITPRTVFFAAEFSSILLVSVVRTVRT